MENTAPIPVCGHGNRVSNEVLAKNTKNNARLRGVAAVSCGAGPEYGGAAISEAARCCGLCNRDALPAARTCWLLRGAGSPGAASFHGSTPPQFFFPSSCFPVSSGASEDTARKEGGWGAGRAALEACLAVSGGTGSVVLQAWEMGPPPC